MTVRAFSHDALILLRQYHWPGNVRELINRIRRAMILCENRLIRPIDLGLERRHYFRHSLTLEQARHIAEHDVIKAALARSKNNIREAAKDLDVSRVTLYRLIEKHNICRHHGDKKLIQPINAA
nr:helix-turn-helix domain-containing protein [uncultured Halomonas sp.]